MESLFSAIPSAQYTVGILLAALYAVFLPLIHAWRTSVKVPPVGSLWSAFSPNVSMRQSRALLNEGYKRHPNAFFKMPLFPFGWMTIANGPKLIDELRSAPDDAFSFSGFSDRFIQMKYTLSPSIVTQRYHVPIVRTTLTRNLGNLFADIIDEMENAFTDEIILSGHGKLIIYSEWKSFPALQTMMKIVCRTSNRVIVGTPLCRNEEYRRINVTFTVDVMKSAFKINMFPSFLHPLVGPLFSKVSSYRKRMLEFVGPLIVERKKKLEQFGPEWAEKPNDYLTWIIEDAPEGPEQTLPYLAMRVLHINFAAIDTSTMAFTHALYHLAAEPQCIKPLREEVEVIIKEEGWTKMAMQKMRKVDSFLRESARVNAIALTSLSRYCVRDYTFADGTTIPKGNYVTASLYSTHMDDSIYKNASEFDPWRFADIRAEDGEGTKHQLIATSPEFLSFGYGKHACPGRFFAANELKAMLCYFVMHYDAKFEKEGVRPLNEYMGASVRPNLHAEILIRKRVMKSEG